MQKYTFWGAKTNLLGAKTNGLRTCEVQKTVKNSLSLHLESRFLHHKLWNFHLKTVKISQFLGAKIRFSGVKSPCFRCNVCMFWVQKWHVLSAICPGLGATFSFWFRLKYACNCSFQGFELKRVNLFAPKRFRNCTQNMSFLHPKHAKITPETWGFCTWKPYFCTQKMLKRWKFHNFWVQKIRFSGAKTQQTWCKNWCKNSENFTIWWKNWTESAKYWGLKGETIEDYTETQMRTIKGNKRGLKKEGQNKPQQMPRA